MSNYWDTVKKEYKESEITQELFEEWMENSDKVRMTQLYNYHPLNWTYIPKNIKILYGE